METWPISDQSLIDEEIEKSFDMINEIVSISSAARMKGKLKRRRPLNQAIICVERGQKEILETQSEMLLSQLNVESCKIVEIDNHDGLSELLDLKNANLPITPKIELERKTIGPKAKQDLPKLLKNFADTTDEEIVNGLENNSSFTFNISENKITLDISDFIVDFDTKDGFTFAKRNNLIVIISTSRNKEMMAKGLVKDLARRLQSLRKDRGYNPTEILNRASILNLDEESLEMMRNKTEDLAFLVRVKEIGFEKTCKEYNDDDVDGMKIQISIE